MINSQSVAATMFLTPEKTEETEKTQQTETFMENEPETDTTETAELKGKFDRLKRHFRRRSKSIF